MVAVVLVDCFSLLVEERFLAHATGAGALPNTNRHLRHDSARRECQAKAEQSACRVRDCLSSARRRPTLLTFM